MFEELVGSKIRIIKADNYTKVGKLLAVENGFLKVQLDSGFTRIEYIALSAVQSVSRVSE